MFDFSLNLSGAGWAVAILREDGTDHEFLAPWLHDGLYEFLAAVNKLFDENEAECWWQQEPGELRWSFIRNGDALEVSAQYPPEEKFENYCYEPDDDFTGTTSFKLFCDQVVAAYRLMLAEWGEEGYASKKGWDYPFPQEELAKLTTSLAAL